MTLDLYLHLPTPSIPVTPNGSRIAGNLDLRSDLPYRHTDHLRPSAHLAEARCPHPGTDVDATTALAQSLSYDHDLRLLTAN